MENKTKTKTFGILSMAEMLAIKARNGTVIEMYRKFYKLLIIGNPQHPSCIFQTGIME